MEYTIIERSPDAFQQPVDRVQLVAMCQCAFGDQIQIESIKELSGGLYNNTYLILIQNISPVILRVNPHSTRQFASEQNLMRNEYASLPFLTPIAPLIPRILMADFTHQIIDRDYLFQTYIEGEQWSQIMASLTGEEKKQLWRQLGSITKKIHSVHNTTFGNFLSGPTFSLWSQTISDCLTTIIHDLNSVHLDATDISRVRDNVQT